MPAACAPAPRPRRSTARSAWVWGPRCRPTPTPCPTRTPGVCWSTTSGGCSQERLLRGVLQIDRDRAGRRDGHRLRLLSELLLPGLDRVGPRRDAADRIGT